MGSGGSHSSASSMYGAGCVPGGQYGYSQQGYYGAGNAGGAGCVGGAYGTGAGFGANGAYGAGGAYGTGYGAGAGGAYGTGAGFGANGAYGAGGAYGTGVGFGANGVGYGTGGAYGAGLGGAYGAGTGVNGAYGFSGAYGAGGYGVTGATTTLGAAAPYGASVYGQSVYGQNVVGTQLANGQYVSGAAVQTVQGAPIYVPQPYPAYYGVSQLRGASAAMPFGFALDGGTEFDVGGDFFRGKESGPAEGGGGTAGAIDAFGYDDAFGTAKVIGGTTEYDLNRNTTVLGRVAYSNSEGQSVNVGSFTPTGSTTARALTGEFSDLETVTLEAGLRKYLGQGAAMRPYVGATGGFVHNNDVNITQTFTDDGSLFNQQQFIDSGWNPTASAVLGAEMAVGPRSAIGIESGIRWTDALDTNAPSDSRISIPLKLRGRVAF